jgi:membrane-associated phospholipid phosphatase
MSSHRADSYFIKVLIISCILLFIFNYIAYSQNISSVDTGCIQTVSSSKTKIIDSTLKKPSNNFYRTDSIFSFHSKKGYFPSLINNLGTQALSPFHFKTKEWVITSAVLGITGTLILVDDRIGNWTIIQNEKHNWINKSSPLITEFGNTYGIYLLGAIGSFSAVCKKEKGVQTSLLATQAFLTSGVWVQVLKTLTGRERPKGAYLYSQQAGGKWNGPFSRFDKDLAFNKSVFAFDAFPSGHTAFAFSIATVFATQYSDIRAIPVISYSLATLAGISRITEQEHWASDVFVGALIGYLCGKQVVKHYNETHHNIQKTSSLKPINKTEITLIQDRNQIGFLLKW